MAKLFQVGIYSTEKTVFEGQAVSLVVPSVEGSLGILADHAPLVAKLGNGKIVLRDGKGGTSLIDSSPEGFLQVLNNQVILLL
ncbi:MAG: F0F1 ATP synthase subunit epsilon [Candidatus Omnitrophica bacterium]|jgi:F-type H+-transporting ATPase subunit epsilon|nr:F0F1 ATP synthase subunit epsilon [Candidatus Omnitrophota bacterium]MDD3274189.1 F0F1 ATP synthase subunit epsilon [Candidatus Omnitrophota bacterium]MDD5078063.1 F0F1 ATP synthase subunit epsilon [Candidatus Omnitrophota bacterium]MDD5725012.1 F0F1 ATP synthase subunit epsilon [Candidatus Omnitrophota bacterium]